MASNGHSAVYKNDIIFRGSDKLYLNHKSADVFFIFHSGCEQSEIIPAHKYILTSMSSVFETILTESVNEINMHSTNANAFKEFLQFFYLSSVKLTAKNYLEVLRLGHEFKINSCIDACMDLCKSTLTLYTMCWGYEIATLLQLDRLKAFCEKQISENPIKIFHSMSFLVGDTNLLRSILQLNTLECNVSDVFDGCIAWAKAKCIQKDLDEDKMQNVRAELGDLFYEIRFGEMSVEEFYACYCSHRDLFSIEEFENIVEMIALKDISNGKFKIPCKGYQIESN